MYTSAGSTSPAEHGEAKMQTPQQTFRTGDTPFTASQPLSRIIKAEPGELQQYVCLSHRLVGVWVHWVQDEGDPSKGRTFPCVGSGEECACRLRFHSLRWQGWIAAMKFGSPVQGMLAITPAAARDFPTLTHRETDLRGMPLRIGRQGNTRQTRQIVLPAIELRDTRLLPVEPDMIAFLHNLWGFEVRKLSERDIDSAHNESVSSSPAPDKETPKVEKLRRTGKQKLFDEILARESQGQFRS